MRDSVKVLVIGGGVVGCSVLYHLTKLGWTDVALCERKELTAGSSWHAAGQIHALNPDPSVSRLQAYTLSLYREIEAASGLDVGLHLTGGLLLAETRDRWDFLRAECARQRVWGASTELISPAQIRDLCPIINTSRVLGALYDPREGHLDPYGVTHAYAKAARLRGAEIYRQTRVMEIRPTGNATWLVVTDQGTIECDHVVNAAGLWAREVGRMVGVELPLVPMEHHYLLTEDLPELKLMSREVPGILDLDGGIYLRQEHQGMLLGVYEKNATPWAIDSTPWDYGETDLLPPNLARIAETLESGSHRFPWLEHVGIRRIVNGPFTFTPDGNPLVGPVPGLSNFWSACGVMAGFSQGGGVGLALANWIVQGDPEGDVYAMDIARFGPYATRNYTVAKAREFYSRRFQIAYPNEYWPAGRPAKQSPIHGALKAANAVFGASYGLEFPRYFAQPGSSAFEIPSLRRSNAFESVAAECRAARSTVGIIDISSFSKYQVTGTEATRALDRLLAGRLPEIARIRLTPMLSTTGRLMGDLTTMRISENCFYISGSGYLQTWHMRWFADQLRGTNVQVRNLSDDYGGIAVVGPYSRELLSRITTADLSSRALPFMGLLATDLALAPALVARISVTGELGYEISVPHQHLAPLLDALIEATDGLDARYVGMYALNSLRLEKGYGIWSREFSPDYSARMAGLDRFIDYEKTDFIGRAAATTERTCIPPMRLVSLAVDAVDVDASGYEPILLGSEIVGFVTSGGYGHCAGTSLAMGYLQGRIPNSETNLALTILGEQRGCRVLSKPAIDPTGTRMRA